MIATIYDVATGELLWTIDADPSCIAAQTAGIRGWVDGAPDPATRYVVDDQVVIRPSLGVGATKALAAGAAWTIAGVPAGTVVVVDGETAGEIGPGVPLAFDTPGSYAVQFRPPFPWRPASCEVTVS